MTYHEKLRLYFKKEGISQKEAAKRLGHAPAMMSRFLSGVSVLDANFITSLVKEFPAIDLQYIFSEENTPHGIAPEPLSNYGVKEDDVIKELEIIEKKLSSIRKVLAQNCHKE